MPSLYKKLSFPLKISSVNVTRSTNLFTKERMENLIFCAVHRVHSHSYLGTLSQNCRLVTGDAQVEHDKETRNTTV